MDDQSERFRFDEATLTLGVEKVAEMRARLNASAKRSRPAARDVAATGRAQDVEPEPMSDERRRIEELEREVAFLRAVIADIGHRASRATRSGSASGDERSAEQQHRP